MSFGKNVEASAIEFLDDGVYLVEKGGMKSGLQILSELTQSAAQTAFDL